ncbi:MAG: type I glyceraldehyde-3-phosphate dehydrogenase [Candidatus Wildermuthbacteria bacterium RIFCSPLOWO2_01_FULL_48_29]|uniref:Type I glyceraldehyde-3-phosphate dehydrogenase n=2 Tax=Candidatus Wildermuthiibacteriota TaxID=1817923 RepID=A0A1G2RJF1_9BACT|nr:MAG: type I glyceraldehyde-3-phosphate dehydrogenase [Candidatus Wildermuthbacteria bacterium RIFCSPHIGHO2_01_FULL_48_27b]OHA72975.1 MAG: type I glyceraldehyde-3-phosphate dehydrogenase [Candidatus Wildermuthbacteria bacterium RIFCSPLOWO2_01_FULL_48_29]
MTKIAINGFGRIGRLFFRQVSGKRNLQVVAINDLGDRENLEYLLKYDTVYGRFEGKLPEHVLQEKDPAKLPWGKLGIDVVVEATGVFDSYEEAQAHLRAGAKRVVITAPAKDEDGELGRTVLSGVNEKDMKACRITSNGSCTTNSIASVIQVLDEGIGVAKALLNTTHGYTATQSLVDGPTRGKDMRRGRAAAQNIIPSSTGAAIATTRAVKSLEGKFDGIALRVPVPAGSIADITFLAKRPTTVEEVNTILTKAASSLRFKNVLQVTQEALVSSDVLGQPYGALVDLEMTRVVGGDLVKVLSWYDNEWGYAATLVRHVEVAAAA